MHVCIPSLAHQARPGPPSRPVFQEAYQELGVHTARSSHSPIASRHALTRICKTSMQRDRQRWCLGCAYCRSRGEVENRKCQGEALPPEGLVSQGSRGCARVWKRGNTAGKVQTCFQATSLTRVCAIDATHPHNNTPDVGYRLLEARSGKVARCKSGEFGHFRSSSVA